MSGHGVVSTPLITGQSLHFLNLESISIGNKILPFRSSKISSNTQGNIFIDSGTLLTLFPPEFYSNLEKTLVASINATRKHDLSGFFIVCYTSKNDIINAPKIFAHFTNPDLELSQANVFTQVDEGLICLTMLPDEGTATFGNLELANFLIGYDLVAKQVSFLTMGCTKH
ncbi:putative aspartic proteinase CDR1-like [Capsicum annuum]|nr:putative aspartic proteinase CDR1-like [Capsicum annuum]